MIILFIFILGLAVGSFAGVLSDRWPTNESIQGRSHCDNCKKNLEAVDLIPVISYIAFHGKCRRCRQKLSIYYPLIELTTAFIFTLVWIGLPSGVFEKMLMLGVMTFLIVILFADLKYYLIPDEALFGLIYLSSLLIIISGDINLQIFIFRTFSAGFLFLLLYSLYIITDAKGIGFGDVKLAGVAGLLLGAYAGMVALYIAFIIGGIVGLLLLLFTKARLKSKLPFGPFIVMGMILVIFLYDNIFSIIQSLFFL